MNTPKLFLMLLLVGSIRLSVVAQACDPGSAPTGLTSTYTPGTGALLEWDAVPGSVAIQLKVYVPSGTVLTKRIGSFELDQFFVPDPALSPGVYTWRVQAACASSPPYMTTPSSITSSFFVGEVGSCPSTVADIDGNVYPTVAIGPQCWMAENLKVEHYQNGDAIPNNVSDSLWSTLTSGACAAYSNDSVNKPLYGLLYNWYAVDDSRGLCPAGWHVPSDPEMTNLIYFLGGEDVAGGKMKATGTLSTGTGLWFIPNAEATNSSGFSAVPGGIRTASPGYFSNRGNNGGYWTTTEYSPGFFRYCSLSNLYGIAFQVNAFPEVGLSVRCLKD